MASTVPQQQHPSALSSVHFSQGYNQHCLSLENLAQMTEKSSGSIWTLKVRDGYTANNLDPFERLKMAVNGNHGVLNVLLLDILQVNIREKSSSLITQ